MESLDVFTQAQLEETAGKRLDPDRLKAEVHDAIERAERE